MSSSGTWTLSDEDCALFRKCNEQSPYFQHNYCAYTYFNGYCGNGKSFYGERFLILVKEKKTWEEAQEFCRTNYTSLSSVRSEMSLRQLNLETVGTETESVWTALSYRCGALNTTTNTLKNQKCNEGLNFVCYWN
ncbi:macrophage mannose receptor 1-like [Tachysurus ichikawai]